jgi:hypothetical protein
MSTTGGHEAIKEFWQSFLLELEAFTKPETRKAAMDRILDALEGVDPHLNYHIGHTNRGQDFLISIEGHLELGPLADQLVQSAPAIPGIEFKPFLASSLLLGKRNAALFPDDHNGDVLFDLAKRGDLLWRVREVDFSLVFPSRGDAATFMSLVAVDSTLTCKISRYDGAKGFSWQAEVTKVMTLSHPAIGAVEQKLGEFAERCGGRNDGWGCFKTP